MTYTYNINDEEGVYGVQDDSLLQCPIHYVNTLAPLRDGSLVEEVDFLYSISSHVHLSVPSAKDITEARIVNEHIEPTFGDTDETIDSIDDEDEDEDERNTLPYPNIDFSDIDLDNPNIKLDNLIDIDPETLKKLLADSKKKSDEVSDMLLTQGSSNLMSLDNASAYAETVLRDGLGVTSTIDTSISIVLSSLLELKLVTYYMDTMGLKENISSTFLDEFIKQRVVTLCENLNKEATGSKYSTVLKNLAGRVTRSKNEGTSNPVGVVKSRSDHSSNHNVENTYNDNT